MNPQHSYITNEISLVFSCLFLEQLMGEQMLSGNEDSSTISQQGKHGHGQASAYYNYQCVSFCRVNC